MRNWFSVLDDDVNDRRRLRCVSKEEWDPRFRDGGSNEDEEDKDENEDGNEDRDDNEEDKDDEDGNGDRDDNEEDKDDEDENAAEDRDDAEDRKGDKDDIEVNELIRNFKISSNAARACLALSPDQSTVATSPSPPLSFFLAPLNRTSRFRRDSSCVFWRARMHEGRADHVGGGSSERRRRGLSLGRVDS